MVKITTQGLLLSFAFSMQIWSFTSYADDPLQQQILRADKQLFTAFNQCDIAAFAAMLDADLEFYHDTGGLTGYDHSVRATQQNCRRNLGLTRTLLSESTKIYPVKEFGAIQLGQHRFCHIENGNNDCGTFGFTHVWRESDGGWKLHRVMSYGH